MRIVTLAALATSLLLANPILAQDKCPVNFDKISLSDFDLSGKNVDTSYGAVVLADVGRSSFDGNTKGFFSLIYKYQRRVKILNSKAFDLATVKIPLYRSTDSDAEELLESLKATTYNVVNGKIEETKLNKDDIYKEVLDKNHVVKKFTLPAVKEGSIIDISYTIKSDYLFNLQPWVFQGAYPRLWSEYTLNLPSFFDYIFLSKGKHPFHIKDRKEKFQTYVVTFPTNYSVYTTNNSESITSSNTYSRWVMKDVPVLREESFTTSMSNHVSRIEFQMAGMQFPERPYHDVMGTWSKATEELLKHPSFGGTLANENSWADAAMASLNLEGKSNMDKAKAIYYYVQKNIKSLGSRGYELTQPLKQTFNNRKGYVPDINLLLVALLNKANLVASPTLISTTDNGMAATQYPLLNQYNYVIASFYEGKQSYLLDASKSGLGFNRLPKEAYNGTMVVVSNFVTFEKILADNITESKSTQLMLLNDPKNKNKWTGKLNSQLGYYESLDLREEVEEKGKDVFTKRITDSYTGEYAADKVELKNFEDFEKPVTISYDVSIDRSEAVEMIYFNPMMKEAIKENYFKSSERRYPVELPFKMDESYQITMNIPEGYLIDELPKSERVTLNDNDGGFEYIISKGDGLITLQTRLKINKAFFVEEEYESLRGFFDYVVKKQAEQIVFRKKP